MDILDYIKEQAATANACFEAGMKASEGSMGDRLIAAGARAADSERKLRRAVEVLNHVADMTYIGLDCECHFKSGYDPQIVLDAIAEASR